MNDVLTLQGIEKTYNAGRPNAVPVLRGVDLVIPRGQVVALVHPRGRGNRRCCTS